MNLGRSNEVLTAFDKTTSITVKNVSVWNNKGLVYIQLTNPQDAYECFKKSLGIDPHFTDTMKNKESMVGKFQIVNITGTITPVVTISRIGTFYTTATPVPLPTEIITDAPEVTSDVTAIATIGTNPLQKKTTYTPLSPLPVMGALVVVCGFVHAIRRK